MKPKLKEHEFRNLVNGITDKARAYSNTQQLRAVIITELRKYIGLRDPVDVMTMDEAIKRRSAEWSVSTPD